MIVITVLHKQLPNKMLAGDMNSWLDGANGRIAVLLPGSHHVTPPW